MHPLHLAIEETAHVVILNMRALDLRALLARRRLPFHDFNYRGFAERAAIRRGMARVLRMNTLQEHAQLITEFEAEFAAACGAAEALAVASGTDALHLALRTVGVGPGHEVIVSANTWITTLTVIFELGASCRFVDVKREDGLLDPALVAAAVRPETRAILPVHMYGGMVPMAEVLAVADKHGLAVVEDACQAVGARYRGTAAGAWGDVGCFSFHVTKLVGAPGDGGMLIAAQPNRLRAIRPAAVAQWKAALHEQQPRVPSRLSPLQVPILQAQLRRLRTRIRERARQWQRYAQGLADVRTARLLSHAAGVESAYRNCILLTPHRQRIMDDCRRLGLPVESIYPASHEFVSRIIDRGDWQLANTAEIARDNISLPLGRQITDRSIDRIVATVRKYH